MIQTGKELAAMCQTIATEYKTSYIWGGIGAPITEESIQNAVTLYAKNQANGYATKARRYLNEGFCFDCVGLIKSILWGWAGDKSKSYGGAKYVSNGVPDVGADQMMGLCKEASGNWETVQIGEAVWKSGHIGVYIGNGLAVECTPAWKCGVQVTAVLNMGKQLGYNGRSWTKHGKLPWLSYEATEPEEGYKAPNYQTAPEITGLPTLRQGAESDTVRALQILLLGYGYDLGKWKDDGEFGEKTRLAVEDFQREHDLEDDGVVGKLTWAALLGVK